MSPLLWVNARIREPQLGMTKGDKVLVAKSREKFTSIGPCWWVYTGTNLLQIAEVYGGRNLYKVLTQSTPFKEQARMNLRYKKLHAAYSRQLYKPGAKRPVFKRDSVML